MVDVLAFITGVWTCSTVRFGVRDRDRLQLGLEGFKSERSTEYGVFKMPETEHEDNGAKQEK